MTDMGVSVAPSACPKVPSQGTLRKDPLARSAQHSSVYLGPEEPHSVSAPFCLGSSECHAMPLVFLLCCPHSGEWPVRLRFRCLCVWQLEREGCCGQVALPRFSCRQLRSTVYFVLHLVIVGQLRLPVQDLRQGLDLTPSRPLSPSPQAFPPWRVRGSRISLHPAEHPVQ